MDRQGWNARYASQPLLWDIDPDPLLRAEVGGLAPGRALDLGAGEGRAARWLAERGWRVTAVDFADVALERGRGLAAAGGLPPDAITWQCADLADYRPPAAVELALLLFVHPPAPVRRRLLADVAAALTPGGVVLVVGYDPSHLLHGSGGPRDPAVLFSPEAIAAELAGLRIDRAERLRVGDAVDTIVRATKHPPGHAGRPA